MSTGDVRSDERLMARLRDLALVDVDALVAGRDDLLEPLADDLADALSCARARAAGLVAELRGADPLGLARASRAVRLRDGGRELEARAVVGLRGRQQAAAALARLDELSARVVPRLFEVERRLGR